MMNLNIGADDRDGSGLCGGHGDVIGGGGGDGEWSTGDLYGSGNGQGRGFGEGGYFTSEKEAVGGLEAGFADGGGALRSENGSGTGFGNVYCREGISNIRGWGEG